MPTCSDIRFVFSITSNKPVLILHCLKFLIKTLRKNN